jgi:16S rRNA (cytosine1402-N4)-methyltransferase
LATSDRLSLIEAPFSAMESELDARDATPVDGVVMDIGVSSMQLDQAERGFSFQTDGPLDMRMSQSGESAADFLNTADEAEIADVIYQYGDEPKSRRVARAIVAARPLTTTGQLASVVRKALGHKPHDKKDPATRTFQAIRIHINRELGELSDGLVAAERVLKPGGRLAVVTFHSLEDRLVKRFFRERSGSTPAGSRHLPPSAVQADPSFENVGRAVRANEREIAANPRARSATLRVARRTSAAPWAGEA